MAIDSEHIEYVRNKTKWAKMRAVLEGEDAMRLNADRYLRKPAKIEAELWTSYVAAVSFLEATMRTVEGMTGLAFYREPSIKLPPALDAFAVDATQDGVPFRQFTESVFESVFGMGRTGIFVDFPKPDPRIRSRLDEERAKRRPFVRQYQTEDVFNWATKVVDGASVLSEVRLREIEVEPTGDFNTRTRKVIRVLQLIENDDGSHYYQQRVFNHRRWESDELLPDAPAPVAGTVATPGAVSEVDWIEAEGSPIIPTLPTGKRLTYIPFWLPNPTDQSPAVKAPPLMGLANLNVTHFNTTAMLENALFWCGNPQPWITGVKPDAVGALTIGSSEAWVFEAEGAEVGMLSLGADDVAPLEKRIDKLEAQMAMLGARALAGEKRQVEAAETARIHQQGEISVLAGVCGSVSRTMEDVARCVADWVEADTAEIIVKIFTAFFDQVVTLSDILQAVKLWQAGFMTVDDVIALLKKGEFTAPDATAESIMSANQSSAIQPIMPELTPNSGGSRPTFGK